MASKATTSKTAKPKAKVVRRKRAPAAKAAAKVPVHIAHLTANGRKHYEQVVADYKPAFDRLGKPEPLGLYAELAEALDDHDSLRKVWSAAMKSMKWPVVGMVEPQMARLKQAIRGQRTLIQRAIGQERRDTYVNAEESGSLTAAAAVESIGLAHKVPAGLKGKANAVVS